MVVERVRWRHYVGIVPLSLATLLLELALTRVLSVALWYHFGFLVISTALLGMALGFSMVLVSAALCYLIALAAMVGSRKAPCMAVH